MYRFLKVLFLLYVGNSLGNRFRRLPVKQESLIMGRGKKRNRYSLNSDRLWEPAPLCKGYKIRYKSKWKNAEGDPVFYKKGNEPLLVAPLTRPQVHGCYSAYPGGLDIDKDTGEIDINNSNTGIRYVVEFTPCGQQCAARTTVIIGGVFWQGSLTSLSSNEPLISVPYYFGHEPNQEVPSRKAPASRYGYIPENVKPTANLKGLFINPDTGEIDLKATIKSGALGFRREEELPVNGSSKDFKVYYQLDIPQSREVLNYSTLRIHFFDHEEDIPEELLARIRQQNNSIFTQGKVGREILTKALPLPLLLGIPLVGVSDSPWEALAALLATLTSFLFLNAASDQPLRPPEHVIIR
jgi:hypothetical protein